MNRRLFQIVMACLPLTVLAESSGEAMPRPNWNTEAATAAADRQTVRTELAELYRLARSSRTSELHDRVEALAAGRDRPAPERDYILYELALALAEAPSETSLKVPISPVRFTCVPPQSSSE